MSADNGIYILHTKDGYRVKHLQAVENLWWSMGEQKLEMNAVEVYLAFHDHTAFSDKETAFTFAFDWAKDIPVLEYGVSELGNEFEDITFYDLGKKAAEIAEKELEWFLQDQKSRKQKDFWKYQIEERKQLIFAFELDRMIENNEI